eukprot:2244892-Pleurochrysis_carterae.AAC.2
MHPLNVSHPEGSQLKKPLASDCPCENLVTRIVYNCHLQVSRRPANVFPPFESSMRAQARNDFTKLDAKRAAPGDFNHSLIGCTHRKQSRFVVALLT